MTWKQKLLSALMAGGFGLRWLAGHDVTSDVAAFRAAAHAIDVALGWMLVVGLILAVRALIAWAHRRLTCNGAEHG